MATPSLSQFASYLAIPEELRKFSLAVNQADLDDKGLSFQVSTAPIFANNRHPRDGEMRRVVIDKTKFGFGQTIRHTFIAMPPPQPTEDAANKIIGYHLTFNAVDPSGGVAKPYTIQEEVINRVSVVFSRDVDGVKFTIRPPFQEKVCITCGEAV